MSLYLFAFLVLVFAFHIIYLLHILPGFRLRAREPSGRYLAVIDTACVWNPLPAQVGRNDVWEQDLERKSFLWLSHCGYLLHGFW